MTPSALLAESPHQGHNWVPRSTITRDTMLESLDTLGWGYVQPRVLVGQTGDEVRLNQVAPETLRRQLEETLEAQHAAETTKAALKRGRCVEQETKYIT